ncbi:phosphate/phosphite/phosphonate ABC transporter substrate-binding protein [Actinomadura violacea]|uniref:Phosphate/phosphite/phosphonate ABC transporter substrate-binding protein n=1 Tax=Actinomadura violacea TaxID=2819934 RepID=A0ABS3RNW4_9ACTN|nr:phosphate/phosphite/phosphonate ABC transporter substrate-binding protein [Actinomadura violacea]MBO2458445.1 phosphate/phosphite/phosphonate ABC transporter substrate-binding protein [Actinomadura violacea]
MTLVMGAVAYDPKVVTIWAGFRAWFARQGFGFDFVLYSHYERQVDDLAAGRIDAAWNSPLAWVRARRLAGGRLEPLVMRDTDQDLTSVVVVREDSPYKDVADLKGETVGTGAADSPQATLIPRALLRERGLRPGEDVAVRRFDVSVGLHGDHVGGERDAARAMMAGDVAAACMIDASHLLFVQEGTLPPGGTRVVGRTRPYDHCVMAARPSPEADRFRDLLLSMDAADPEVRTLFDLEGLTAWRPARTTGFALLEQAVDDDGFYGPDGAVTAPDYRP